MINRFIFHSWKTLLAEVISKINIIVFSVLLIHCIFFVKNSYAGDMFLVLYTFRGLHLWFVKIITN